MGELTICNRLMNTLCETRLTRDFSPHAAPLPSEEETTSNVSGFLPESQGQKLALTV